MAGCKILFTTAFRPDLLDAHMLAVISCFVVISAVTSGDRHKGGTGGPGVGQRESRGVARGGWTRMRIPYLTTSPSQDICTSVSMAVGQVVTGNLVVVHVRPIDASSRRMRRGLNVAWQAACRLELQLAGSWPPGPPGRRRPTFQGPKTAFPQPRGQGGARQGKVVCIYVFAHKRWF
jgi:hypothetical protein